MNRVMKGLASLACSVFVGLAVAGLGMPSAFAKGVEPSGGQATASAEASASSGAASDVHASVVVETLLKTSKSWDGTPYGPYPSGTPEVTILKIVIPPHATLPWHTHPMLNAAYVLSGELTVETQDGKKRPLKAGDVLPESVGVVHRGYTGDHPVTLIVFYAGAQGMKLNEAVK